MNSYIGWWARRKGKWHLVESEVVDRLVTHCGRQLRLTTKSGPLTFLLGPTERVCKVCE
jgi:hypothetical protein